MPLALTKKAAAWSWRAITAGHVQGINCAVLAFHSYNRLAPGIRQIACSAELLAGSSISSNKRERRMDSERAKVAAVALVLACRAHHRSIRAFAVFRWQLPDL